MPCVGCGVEFGRFRREHGCKNCGFTFCNNCLTKKAPIPKLGDKKHSVCGKCFEILTSQKPASTSGRFSPPAALQKRLDAYSEKQQDRSKDEQLRARLDKMREERRGRIPTDLELEERLANLKGTSVISSQQSQGSLGFRPDRRTAAEQTTDILNQITEEVKLDSKRLKPEDEIAQRLQRLKSTDDRWNDLNNPGSVADPKEDNAASFLNNKPVPKSDSFQNLPPNIAGSSCESGDLDEVHKLMEAASKECQLDAERNLRQLQMDKQLHHKLMELKANQNRKSSGNVEEDEEDDEDENKLTDKLIEKLLAENELDEASRDMRMLNEEKELNMANSDSSQESDELPWCNVCNEDATLRCIDCEGELYCDQCFKEYHETFDHTNHVTAKYKPPKN